MKGYIERLHLINDEKVDGSIEKSGWKVNDQDEQIDELKNAWMDN